MSEPVSRRSAFAEKSADEIARSYLGWFRRLRACCAVAAVIVGTVAVAGLVVLDSLALYLLGLAALVGVGVYVRWRVNREFQTLIAIINTDCDAGKWRGVISRLREHDARRRRARSLCDCYLAIADLEELRPADALARMSGLSFGRRSALNVMLYQNRAVCASSRRGIARAPRSASWRSGSWRTSSSRSSRGRHGTPRTRRAPEGAWRPRRPIVSTCHGRCSWPTASCWPVTPPPREGFWTRATSRR